VLAFLQDAFHHCKAIGASGEGVELLKAAHLDGVELSDAKPTAKAVVSKGVVTAQSDSNLGSFEKDFVQAIAQHRHWEREEAE
jgi:catalase